MGSAASKSTTATGLLSFETGTTNNNRSVKHEARHGRVIADKRRKLEDNGFRSVYGDPSLQDGGSKLDQDRSNDEDDEFAVMKIVIPHGYVNSKPHGSEFLSTNTSSVNYHQGGSSPAAEITAETSSQSSSSAAAREAADNTVEPSSSTTSEASQSAVKGRLLSFDRQATSSYTTPIALNLQSRLSGLSEAKDLVAKLGRLCVCYGFWLEPISQCSPDIEIFRCTGPFPRPPGYVAQGRCPVEISISGSRVSCTTEVHNHPCIGPGPASMDRMISAINPVKSHTPARHSLSQQSESSVGHGLSEVGICKEKTMKPMKGTEPF